MNRELSDVQAGFRKGRGTGDQIANIYWIIKKAREFQKNICFIEAPPSLESPRDGGAWWAAVHGVAKSRTQLSN